MVHSDWPIDEADRSMRLRLRRWRHNTCCPLALFPLWFRVRIGVVGAPTP